MGKEQDIYKVLVDKHPYKLNRAEIRRATESRYSDGAIKRVLDGLLDRRAITKSGRDYSAGRIPVVNDRVHEAIVEDIRKILPSDPFGFANEMHSIRYRLANNRIAVLTNLIYWELEIHLDSIRFEKGVPIEKYENDRWFIFHRWEIE